MALSEVPAPSGGTDLQGRTAAEVRAWIARRKLNVPRVAALTGMSPAYLYRRVNGETALDMNDLEVLARALQVSVISLLPAQEQTAGVTRAYSQTSAPIDVQIGWAA
jgi:transcriptional regulator with XRE-family HTH domain